MQILFSTFLSQRFIAEKANDHLSIKRGQSMQVFLRVLKYNSGSVILIEKYYG